jgi:hypothetical protein
MPRHSGAEIKIVWTQFGCTIGGAWRRPTKLVRARAERFRPLVDRDDHLQPSL